MSDFLRTIAAHLDRTPSLCPCGHPSVMHTDGAGCLAMASPWTETQFCPCARCPDPAREPPSAGDGRGPAEHGARGDGETRMSKQGCHCDRSLNDAAAEHGTEDWEPFYRVTPRGFGVATFYDRLGQDNSIQESSSIDGGIWLGVGSCRMHLSDEQVRSLAHVLVDFLTDGNLSKMHGARRPAAAPEATDGEDTPCSG